MDSISFMLLPYLDSISVGFPICLKFTYTWYLFVTCKYHIMYMMYKATL
jgi:hypothetical protein